MCLTSWERTQKKDPSKLFRGDFERQGHKKFTLLYFLPLRYHPKKVYVGPFLSLLQGSKAGAPQGTFWGGGKQYTLTTKFMVFSPEVTKTQPKVSPPEVFFAAPWGHGRSRIRVVDAPKPKGLFRTKNTTTIVKIANYYAVVILLRPPNLLRRGPFFERRNVCNFQENGVRGRCAAIVNHPAVLKILRIVNLLRVLFLVRRGPLGMLVLSRLSRAFLKLLTRDVRTHDPGTSVGYPP